MATTTSATETELTANEIAQLREEYLLPSTMKYFQGTPNIIRGEMQFVYDDQGIRYNLRQLPLYTLHLLARRIFSF